MYKQSTNMLQNLEICFFLFVYYSSDGNLVIFPN